MGWKISERSKQPSQKLPDQGSFRASGLGTVLGVTDWVCVGKMRQGKLGEIICCQATKAPPHPVHLWGLELLFLRLNLVCGQGLYHYAARHLFLLRQSQVAQAGLELTTLLPLYPKQLGLQGCTTC